MQIDDIAAYMAHVGAAARTAATAMAAAPTAAKDAALRALARRLREAVPALQQANAPDIAAAEAAGLAAPLVDRLRLTPQVIETVAEGCEQLAAMPDPIGEITGRRRRPSGISVGQMRVPLGVFGMIYESRPNVTIEAASLAIKSGNSCILRGGSEALRSTRAESCATTSTAPTVPCRWRCCRATRPSSTRWSTCGLGSSATRWRTSARTHWPSSRPLHATSCAPANEGNRSSPPAGNRQSFGDVMDYVIRNTRLHRSHVKLAVRPRHQ
jgi:hypothetical protein